MGSGKSWKITESCLFEMRRPKIIGKAKREKPPDPKWFSDIHFWSLSALPTAVLLLLGTKLIGWWYTLVIPLNLIQLVVIYIAIGKVLSKRKEKSTKEYLIQLVVIYIAIGKVLSKRKEKSTKE